MVMAIIYFMGSVAGRTYPAVTLAFAVRAEFPWNRVPGYWWRKSSAGSPRRGFSRDVRHHRCPRGDRPGPRHRTRQSHDHGNRPHGRAGEHHPRHRQRRRNIGTNGALAVGGYIALAGLWAAPITGASMNPIRSLAPDLVRGNLSTSWIYIAGPILGALIGVLFQWLLRGKPTAAGAIAAQGFIEPPDE